MPPMTRGPYASTVLIVALCLLASVTFAIWDPDVWQHLAVGRTIWRTLAIPDTQIWTWPTYGAPDVLPSWLFRVLLWPFYEWGGTFGLFVWRWLTTLVAFGLMWRASRRMGATGVAPLVMLVWCGLLWRHRSPMRPETFTACLLAAQLLLLEMRRARATIATRPGLPDPAWGIVPLAWLWANAHISYYLGFVMSGAYLLDDLLHRRQGRRPGVLALALLAAAAVSFVNPFDWRALAQPLEYFTIWRHEPIYMTIGELSPTWTFLDLHVRDGLLAWLAIVVVAAALRARRHGVDAAQVILMGVCLTQAMLSHRFLGYAALVLAPFAVRDVADMVGRVRWPAALTTPGRRALLASAASIVLVLPSLTPSFMGLGYGWVHTSYPERACDWIERHDVRGRGFNVFAFGGYLLYRFHPDPGRLPFMDIHQAGTRSIRYMYAWALQDPRAWTQLDRTYRFDWVLLPRTLPMTPSLIDQLDADSTWALVFADDAASLWLRSDGSGAALARDSAYRVLPAGSQATGAMGDRLATDPGLRAAARTELARAITASPWNAGAHTLAGNLAMIEERWADARTHFDEAVRQQPAEAGLLERQGVARLYSGDPVAARASFQRLRRMQPLWPAADLWEGASLAALGRRAEARRLWQRSLEKHPGITEARDSLASR